MKINTIILIMLCTRVLCADTSAPVLISSKSYLFGCTDTETICAADRTSIMIYSPGTGIERIIRIPEPDAVIQCVGGIGGYFFVGTNKGILQWDNVHNQWSSYGEAYNNVHDIACAPDRVFVLDEAQVYSYQKESSRIFSYTLADNISEEFTNIETFGNELWGVGKSGVYATYLQKNTFYPELSKITHTPGLLTVSGIYLVMCGEQGTIVVYNRFDKTIHTYHLSATPGRFITALMLDGKYVWVGTFDGLVLFDCALARWIQVPPMPDDGSPVNGFIDGGNDIYVLSEHGLFSIKKPYTSCALTPECSVITDRNSDVMISMKGFGETAEEATHADYRLSSFPERWIPAVITVENGSIAWNTTTLPSWNEEYEFRVNGGGSCVFHMDAEEPHIYFNPPAGICEPGLYTVRGRFNKDAVSSILLQPYAIEPLINREDRSFKAVVTLQAGANVITAAAVDRLGRKSSAEINLYVSDKK